MEKKGKILVVDDEQIILTAFQIELQDAGHDVKIALSGREALELISQEGFDIVYTDLIMPEMNGTELCQKIKKITPQTEVILFSGNPYEVEEQLGAFIEAGGRDEMLRKPLGDNVLVLITKNLFAEVSYKKGVNRIGGGIHAS